MSLEKDESPAADWVDLVVLLGVFLIVVRSSGGPGGETLSAGAKWVAAGACGAVWFLRRRLGLGPARRDPTARSLGLVGALATVMGVGLAISGVALVHASLAERTPRQPSVAEVLSMDALGGGLPEEFLAHTLARAAECEKSGSTMRSCPSAKDLAVAEALAATARERRMERLVTMRAESAAMEAQRESERRARWPFGASLAGIGVMLIATVSWAERRVRA